MTLLLLHSTDHVGENRTSETLCAREESQLEVSSLVLVVDSEKYFHPFVD